MRVVALREEDWFDKAADEALHKQTCAAYGVDFEMCSGSKPSLATKNLIIFEESGTIDLEDFEHPEDAVYLFGRSGYNLRLWFPEAVSVRINTPGGASLFGCVACGIVLEDRKRKLA